MARLPGAPVIDEEDREAQREAQREEGEDPTSSAELSRRRCGILRVLVRWWARVLHW